MTSKQIIQQLLSLCDIKINGNNPWDIQVHNKKFYSRILRDGSLGLGESYMDGWWDCKYLDQFFYKILSAQLDKKIITPKMVANVIKAKLFNMQNISRSRKVAEEHYDLGNEFYSSMLDKRMQYTCAYWKNAKNLDQAQENKLDLICKKLKLKKGESVLELGCGWGELAKYMAEKYKCKVTAYNISKEQLKYARLNCKGLPINFIEKDYRLAVGKYDKIVSIGLCEHIGYKNYKNFMLLVNNCLKDNGLFLLHTIGKDISVTTTDPWIAKYIFPNSMLPSVKQISTASEGLFVLEDWHNFGADYDTTLMAWYSNFEKNWDKFEIIYGKRFYRMWRYYLLSCAGLFRARRTQLWQVIFSKNGYPNGYVSIR